MVIFCKVHKLEEMAKAKNCTTSQLAMAWLLHKGKDIFPLFGTTRIDALQENCQAVNVKLNEEEMKKINELANYVQGGRYPAYAMHAITTDK